MNLTIYTQDDLNMKEPVEGRLLKFTNVVKGWQFRHFCLNPESGTLDYYMLDEISKARPRGSVNLAGAVVSPSDEDGQTFTVSAVCGEVYRLKAHDARERQFWIQRLRVVVEQQAQNIAEKNPPLNPRNRSSSPPFSHKEVFGSARKKLNEASGCHHQLSSFIDKLPLMEDNNTYCNLDLLLLKSTSNAILLSLEQCLSILIKNQMLNNMSSHSLSSIAEACTVPDEVSLFSGPSQTTLPTLQNKDASGEILDVESEAMLKIGLKTELYKCSMLPLLTTLKLGTNLTHLRFPTQVLEPTSLLEMVANFLSQPQYLVSITDQEEPMRRMILVIKWYLSMFSLNWRQEALSKPLNSVVGETFHCSWKVPQKENYTQVTFLGEQVSHQPPVSAFYVECAEKKVAVEGFLGLTSRFLGMSIVVNCDGHIALKLLSLGEEYIMSLPTVSIQSILSCPWPELGGRISITCKSTGLSARLTFHTKPLTGGVGHKVTGEIKNQANVVVCKINGQWHNEKVEFTFSNGEVEEISLSDITRAPKYVRPVEQQDECESRKLWTQVIEPLQGGEYEQADIARQQIEETHHQYNEERKLQNKPYGGKLFRKEGETWEYKYPLIIN